MHSSKRLISIILLALLAVAGSAVVYMVDPAAVGWMPKCPFHVLTGLDCPSCGSTRAFHHILHGEVADGLAYNPMLPVLWILGGAVVVVGLCGEEHRSRSLLRWLAGAYIAVYLLWGIVRNFI